MKKNGIFIVISGILIFFLCMDISSDGEYSKKINSKIKNVPFISEIMQTVKNQEPVPEEKEEEISTSAPVVSETDSKTATPGALYAYHPEYLYSDKKDPYGTLFTDEAYFSQEIPSYIKNRLNCPNEDTNRIKCLRVARAYSYIPERIRTSLEKDGVTITVEDSDDFSKEYDIDIKVYGLSVNNGKEHHVYIDPNAPKTVIHEIGHQIDRKQASDGIWLSDTKEFKAIWRSEWMKIKKILSTNEANIDDTTEYFADAYFCYVLSPEELKQVCPATYEYIRTHIGSD